MTDTTPLEQHQEREWTLWSDQRPPNAPGEYRYRATFPFLGLTVTAEWTEKMRLCGMGYSESEWWPLDSCRWDGYRRYITVKGLEWSPVQAYDPGDTVWHGLDLRPCPFTGKPARLEPVGQFIGAPLWRSEAVYIWSAGVPKRRWTDAKAMQAAWNTRANADARLVEALREAIGAIENDTGLDEAICCSGHDCGCRASTHRDLLLHNLRAALSEVSHG